LFNTEEELRAYQAWQLGNHPRSYLSFAGLSEAAENLVSGARLNNLEKRYILT
jgi:hypothetical protein